MTDIATLAEFDSAIPVAQTEAAEAPRAQDTGFDVVALLLIVLVVITFNILSLSLRNDSPTGQAFKSASLREVLTFTLGLVVIALAAGENSTRPGRSLANPAVRWLFTGIGGFYGLYAVLLVLSAGQLFYTGPAFPPALAFVISLLPIFAQIGTIISVVLFVLLLGVTIASVERKPGIGTPIRSVASAILGLYTLYVGSYVFFGLEIATDTILPTIVELAALVSIVALWQPWNRLSLYRRNMGRILPPLVIMIVALVFWEWFVQFFGIKELLLPAPSTVITTFTATYSRLVNSGWLTFQNALWGFGIGCGTGVAFGLLSARFSGFNQAMLPYAIAVNSIPIIAFAPITNAWFSSTNPASKIAIVALLVFFPALINTSVGLSSADPAALELMRSLAASELDIFRKVRLPVALPYIFNGLKIATSLSMIGAIVAEYFGGPISGLGSQIRSNAQLLDSPSVWSEIIIASILGIIFYFVVSLAERLIMPWHISFRPRAD